VLQKLRCLLIDKRQTRQILSSKSLWPKTHSHPGKIMTIVYNKWWNNQPIWKNECTLLFHDKYLLTILDSTSHKCWEIYNIINLWIVNNSSL
jgi:hypothetical protein